MAVNFGTRRIVVGAHYGLRDWLSQRVTAGLMALFTRSSSSRCYRLPASSATSNGPASSPSQWMKVLTFVVIVALAYHVWVGMRDIWMDYVQPVAVRLLLQVFSIVWLVGCAGWAIQVLWRL